MTELSERLRRRAVEVRREHRADDAKRDLSEAVALCRQAGDEIDLAIALTALGQIERDIRNNDAALKHFEEAAAIYRAKADVQKLAHSIRHIGDIHQSLGHIKLAETCYREALDLYRRDKSTTPLDLANAIRGFAILKHDAGDTETAKRLWEEARDLYAAVNVMEGVDESSRRLALLAG